MNSSNQPKPIGFAKPNYFKTFLSNYLAQYKDVLTQPNIKQRLKELEISIKFCIDKFRDENDLILMHHGHAVAGVSFEYSESAGLQVSIY